MANLDRVSAVSRKSQLGIKRRDCEWVDPSVDGDRDWLDFCEAFRLNPNLRTFDLNAEKTDPYLKDMPDTGLAYS